MFLTGIKEIITDARQKPTFRTSVMPAINSSFLQFSCSVIQNVEHVILLTTLFNMVNPLAHAQMVLMS